VGGRVLECRYGENGYQVPAALYSTASSDLLALDRFQVVAGAAPSYNNLCDVDRLTQTMTHIAAGFEKNKLGVPFIAVGVKHGNPCGAAVGIDALEVADKMLRGDALAIFGGLVMTNFPIDDATAEVLHGKNIGKKMLLDGVIAPAFTEGAIETLKRKGDKCRFIANPALADIGLASLDTAVRFRYVRGGFLSQPNYTYVPNFGDTKEVTVHGHLDSSALHDIILAWAVGSTSNSNTITLVKAGILLGNGVGQQDRVGGANLAITRAQRSGHETGGAVAYSDSFFPFTDGVQVLLDARVRTIFATSGSVRDSDVIALCKEREVTLVMAPDAATRGFYGH
jgi:phosphoribosylaminoimidazolecarboxamide formyltransferase/IMP cyclohydrolase